MSVTATEARKTLFPLIRRVNENCEAIEIVSHHGNAVLMSADEYASWKETDYLLRSPENARRLLGSLADAKAGRFAEHELVDA